MIRIFLTLFLAVMVVQAASAQIPEHSVGLRYGTVFGLGTEVSYQRGLSSKNRLEFNLGYNSDYEYINDLKQDYNSWALSSLYHWVWKLEKLDDNLNWYAGPGAGLGYWSSGQKYDSPYHNGMFLMAEGDVGIEYCLPAGIQFSLDARPEIGLVNHGSGVSIGFSVRYQFR